MNNRRHHFVPQFYLRRFSGNGRQLNVFNLRRAQPFLGVSLRDQAYRPRFYGADNAIENFFRDNERQHAPLIDRILASDSPPANDTPDHAHLCIFLALQMIRTTTAEQESAVQMDSMLKEIVRAHPEGRDLPLDGVRAEVTNSIVLRLQNAPLFAIEITDLELVLVAPPEGHEFLLSDNPVVSYNQYAEAVKDRGTTGLSLAGLQLFAPLSPRRLLLLFDPNVYALRCKATSTVVPATVDDVFQANLLQATFTDQNLYFRNVPQDALRTLARAAQRRRRQHLSSFKVLTDPNSNPPARLVIEHTQVPCLPLRLSFLRLSRAASAVVPSQRWAYRKGHRPEPSADSPDFSRFIPASRYSRPLAS